MKLWKRGGLPRWWVLVMEVVRMTMVPILVTVVVLLLVMVYQKKHSPCTHN